MPEIRSNKLADGRDPIELGAALRNELEVRGYQHQHTSTWLHPQTGVKAVIGYAGSEYRLFFYKPGQVAGPPVRTVSMTLVAHLDRADTALAEAEFDYRTAA